MPDPTDPGAPDRQVQLALVVNTRDEARRLPRLFASTEGVDEIVVGDMESTDETRTIAVAHGAKVVDLPNAGYCEPGRMPAIRAASSAWVLLLDADERLVPGALAALRRLLAQTPPGVSAYRVPRTNHIGTRTIVGSGWGGDLELHARVFRRDDVTWPDAIHGKPTFTGEVLDLERGGPITIEHDNFDNVGHLLEKLNRYSSVEAEQFERDERPSLPMSLRYGLEEVVHRYDPEADGSLSLALAFAMLGYRLSIGAKAAELAGWPEEPVIARRSMLRSLNAFWSTLRTNELAEVPSAIGDRESDDAERELGRRNELWAESPTSLSDRLVDVGDPHVQGPWAELLADDAGRATRLAEAVAHARAELHRERRRATQAEVVASDATAESEDTRRLFEELLSSAAEAGARLERVELALAEAQSRVEELERELAAAPDLPPSTGADRLRAAARRRR